MTERKDDKIKPTVESLPVVDLLLGGTGRRVVVRLDQLRRKVVDDLRDKHWRDEGAVECQS
jgi:hypothetical protein